MNPTVWCDGKEQGCQISLFQFMIKILLKAVNFIVSFIVFFSLCTAGVYAAYALWDNSRIYAAAKDVQADMLKLKPQTQDVENGASFEELLAVNPDVCAWVSLDNTKVDYPVLQGDTNLAYINKDVYGNFALAGSIFLDSRNDRTFADTYSLLYGHHMENSGMFGDLELYKKKAFFDDNTTGMLILPDRAYKLEILACLIIPVSDDFIFNTEQWQADIDGELAYIEENALYLHENTLEEVNRLKEPKLLALSTCSTEFTDARTIILAVMKPYQTAD
ncbi:sortase, SrtB family [Clostridium sp. KLE 1755]|uniref:class B sortase n=1 Tax=Clostridia TaxID=186801 RepID=UPI00039687A3|nr:MULTISPECIES: class B sortase [Clostridia]ERI68623.1 sortase, SrtB family [Clostridium sp. KLE 1755]MDU5289351.1 class B sortase [Clostridium sp.]